MYQIALLRCTYVKFCPCWGTKTKQNQIKCYRKSKSFEIKFNNWLKSCLSFTLNSWGEFILFPELSCFESIFIRSDISLYCLTFTWNQRTYIGNTFNFSTTQQILFCLTIHCRFVITIWLTLLSLFLEPRRAFGFFYSFIFWTRDSCELNMLHWKARQ